MPNVSENALNLINNLIVFNPNYRLTAVEALEHPYVTAWVKLFFEFHIFYRLLSLFEIGIIDIFKNCLFYRILFSYFRFHVRGDEPERGSNVIPLLRDDVQLSVEEYRNQLYAMMDEKHRKHKNM